MENLKNKIKCTKCDRHIQNNMLPSHYTRCHDFDIRSDYTIFSEYMANKWNIHSKAFVEYFSQFETNELLGETKKYNRFTRYITEVQHESEFNDETLALFKEYLEFTIQHPGTANNKKLYKVLFKEDWEKYYTKFAKSINPFTGHGSNMSPFSTEFVGYKDKTEEETHKLTRSVIDRATNNRVCPNQIEYWIAKGFNKEESKNKVSDYQRTFTKETCIAKYGEEAGLKRWQEHQDKWQAVLKAKPQEEIDRINRLKMSKGYTISKAELELIKLLNLNEKENSQHILTIENKKAFVYDICVGNKIIEYNGDFLHANPNKYTKSWVNTRSKKLL